MYRSGDRPDQAGRWTVATRSDSRLGILGREVCLRLLATDEIGRLAVVVANTPLVVPVDYALDGEAVVFRTDPGTKFGKGPRSRASFEVDSFDRHGAPAGGWSRTGAWRRSRASTRPRSSACDGSRLIRGPGARRRTGCARSLVPMASPSDPSHQAEARTSTSRAHRT